MKHLIGLLLPWLLALPCLGQYKDLNLVADDVPENPYSRFRIRGTVDRPDRRYTPGDTLTLTIKTSRDCYVTIFDVGTSGKVTVLLPNRFPNGKRNFVRAGTPRQFPDPRRDGFRYTISPPPGLERLVIVGTTQPVNLAPRDLPQYARSSRGVFAQAEARDAQKAIDYARDVLVGGSVTTPFGAGPPKPPGPQHPSQQGGKFDWASDQVPFWIGKAYGNVQPPPPPVNVPEPPGETPVWNPPPVDTPEPPPPPPPPPPPNPPPVQPPPQPNTQVQKWAFVGAVADYPGGNMDLDYTVKDAEVFDQLLQRQMGVPNNHIMRLYNGQCTMAAFRQGMAWLAQNAGSDDLVYIYYSGHGGYKPDQDGDEEDGQDEFLYVYDGEVLDDDYGRMVNRIRASKIWEVTDTCYSGGTSRSINPATGRTRGIGLRGAKVKTIMPPPLAPGTRAIGPQPEDLSDGFGPAEWRVRTREVAPTGVSLMAASQPNQPSQETDDLQHGVFTYFLAQGMRGSADTNRDGQISLGELFIYTKREVSKYTNGDQVPMLLPAHADMILTR